MTLIEQIATLLQTNGVGTLGTNLFVSRLPDNIDSCVGVFDTGGLIPNIDIPLGEPTFQVYIRAVSYEAGKTKLDAVRALLHRRMNQVVITGGTYAYYIYAMSEGGHVGQNERGQDEFSINFKILTR